MSASAARAYVDSEGDVILNAADIEPSGPNGAFRVVLVTLTAEQAEELAAVKPATLELLEARVREDVLITLGEARATGRTAG